MTGSDVAVPDPQGWLNVADGIFHNARRRSSHPAIVDGARTISYAELAELTAKTAGHLADIGAKPGDMIGVALGDDADHVVALLAIAWLGGIILPMDVRWTGEEKRRIASHFGARFVLVPDGDAAIADTETVALDTAWRQGVAAHGGEVAFVRRREQPLLLSLSSGTTGAPKGPLVTHGHSPFPCACGAADCRGTIRGYRHLGAAGRHRLEPVISAHLREMLAMERSET